MLAERPAKGKKKETALVGPGSILDAAAYLSSTRSRASMRAATVCRLAAFGAHELEALLVSAMPGIIPGHVCHSLGWQADLCSQSAAPLTADGGGTPPHHLQHALCTSLRLPKAF
jgi:hypothetical protein